MLNAEQLEIIESQLSKRLKEDKHSLSDYNKECSKLWDEVRTHATKDFPGLLISKKHPSETSEEFNYRKDTYQAITSSYWHRALNSVNRIWQNHSVEFEDDYFTANYPVYKSLLSFFRSIVTPQKINDPNTILAVKPFEIPVIETDEGVEVNDAEFIQPVAALFPCTHVVDFVPGAYFIGLTNLKTQVQTGNKKEKKGLVFEIYDDQNIYRLKQVGKQIDYDFEIDIYYQHGLGYLPAWALAGIPKHREDRIIYESYFSPAIPLLNESTLYNSTNSGVIGKHGYPTRAYIEEDCDNPDCKGGYVFENEEQNKCPVCLGTQKKRFSPFTDYVRRIDSRFDDPNIPFPGIEYISPPIEPMQFLDEKVEKGIVSAFQIINIDVSNVPNGQTATQSKIDREELFSFLLQVSYELNSLLKNTINAIGQMRYPTWYEPEMIIPDEFTIRSSSDLTEEIKTASDSNLPDLAIDRLHEEYVKRRFNEDEMANLYFNLKKKTDALRNKTDAQVSIIINSGNAMKWQGVLHTNFDIYVEEFLESNPNFLTQSDAKSKLIERAKQDTPSDTIRDRLLNANA